MAPAHLHGPIIQQQLQARGIQRQAQQVDRGAPAGAVPTAAAKERHSWEGRRLWPERCPACRWRQLCATLPLAGGTLAVPPRGRSLRLARQGTSCRNSRCCLLLWLRGGNALLPCKAQCPTSSRSRASSTCRCVLLLVLLAVKSRGTRRLRHTFHLYRSLPLQLPPLLGCSCSRLGGWPLVTLPLLCHQRSLLVKCC